MIGLMEGKDDVRSALLTNPVAQAPPLCGGPLEAKRNMGSGNARSSLFQNQSRDNCSLSVADWQVDDGSFFTLSCPLPPPPASLIKKLGAEFIGTFILIFAGTAAPTVKQQTLVGLAASNGLAVMIVILSTGHISGAHLNPAVTIAFAALRYFPWKQVPMYIGAQVVAAVWAAFATRTIFQPETGVGLTVPTGSHVQAFALEFIITFILMFVITAVATDSLAVGELAGIAGGATVMFNVLIAGEITGASMNPVRTLGPAIAAKNFRAIWVYLTAPILGALCGAGAYTAVKLREPSGFKTSPKGYK